MPPVARHRDRGRPAWTAEPPLLDSAHGRYRSYPHGEADGGRRAPAAGRGAIPGPIPPRPAAEAWPGVGRWPRPPRAFDDAPFIRACRRLSVDRRAGVVHAPGRPVAARVPGGPGTGQHPRRHRPTRAGGRAHPPAGRPLRHRCRHLLLRHRGPGGGHRLRGRRGPGHRPGGGRALPDARTTSSGSGPSSPRPTRPYVIEAVGILADELEVPLIGFAGGPFTVASYLVEGGPSKNFTRIKALMHGEPPIWHELVERLTDLALASLRSQLDAGASAVQVFDSWAGILTPRHYRGAGPARHPPALRRAGRVPPRRAHHPLRRGHRRAAGR